jgi:hypothetical protein
VARIRQPSFVNQPGDGGGKIALRNAERGASLITRKVASPVGKAFIEILFQRGHAESYAKLYIKTRVSHMIWLTPTQLSPASASI